MLKVRRSTVFAYMLPMLIMLAVLNLTPIFYTLYLSTTNNTLFNDEYKFIGLTNYQTLLFRSDSDLYYVMGLTVLYVVVCIALFLIVGLATALSLNNPKIKGQPFWRAVMIVPWAMPYAISSLIWKFLFNYDFGPINQIGRVFFGPGFGIPWLTNPILAFMAVVIVNVWLTFPFFTVVILGSLQSIPQEINESARVDGANAWQRFTSITLPLLAPAITPATILSAVTTFQMFGTVYFITQGGPITDAAHPGATSFVMIYMYLQVLGGAADNIHYAQIAAFAVSIFLILGSLTFLASATASWAQNRGVTA